MDGAQNLIQFVAKMLNDPSANPLLLVDTLQDESNWRTAYENARNWAELMASGVNLSTFVTPEIYIRSQMEADVSWSLGQNKRDDLPDPVAATLDFYNLFVKMFGQQAGIGGRECDVAGAEEFRWRAGHALPGRDRRIRRVAVPEPVLSLPEPGD